MADDPIKHPDQNLLFPVSEMRFSFRAFALLTLSVLLADVPHRADGQFNLPGFGQRTPASNDQKVDRLLHENLPLVLDANAAYPTVPNETLLGGPFHGQELPITLDTLTKPLPPGDYSVPMTFFCSEYSIHRPGAGTAYVLAPARGTAAKAISTLLWRGMLTGHKPQELQSVSWAIQGSVAYDKMPPSYKRLVDELIPDMKNQVNGQAFADIEDGFQGKVNKFTRKVSEKATEGLGKVTGGRGRVDIKVDVELNQSFGRLGRLGQAALDGEKLSTIVTAAFPTDEAREHALYAGQGTQAPPLPAANGPWSVIVPGVAYMRYVVHGGNLQSDNTMQIRIVRPGTQKTSIAKPHLVLAQYPQSFSTAPSLTGLVGGTVNQPALSQCLATSAQPMPCAAANTDMSGVTAYSVGAGAQASLIALGTQTPSSSPESNICVRKVIYEPTRVATNERGELQKGVYGLCIYLAAVKDVNNSCGTSPRATLSSDENINWVQTFITNADSGCKEDTPHKDKCVRVGAGDYERDLKSFGPMYRPDRDPHSGGNNRIFNGAEGSGFALWKQRLAPVGDLQLMFRDIPTRDFSSGVDYCTHLQKGHHNSHCTYTFHTAEEDTNRPTLYANPPQPAGYITSGSALDNDLRLVKYKRADSDPNHFNYTPLIEIKYGYRVDQTNQTLTVDPLVIGDEIVNTGGTISLGNLEKVRPRSAACWSHDPSVLEPPPLDLGPFPYDTRPSSEQQ